MIRGIGINRFFVFELFNFRMLFFEWWILVEIRLKRICFRDRKVVFFYIWLFGFVRYFIIIGMRYLENISRKFDLFFCKKMVIGGICFISLVRIVGFVVIKNKKRELYKNKLSILYSIYW